MDNSFAATPPERKRREANDAYRVYEEIIKENIEYDFLLQDYRLEKDRIILNSVNFDNYIYPSRYNDEREMTRYFSFEFIDGREVTADVDWLKKSEDIEADGVVYGVLPESEEVIREINTIAIKTSPTNRQAIFVIPKHYRDIESIVREYYAVKTLRDETGTADRILFDEYTV